MKQIWSNYSYSPATNVLTLTGLNIDRDQLLLVAAPERGRIMYNFADSSVTASAFTAGANTSLTLVASTAGLTTTASLVIYYDDQLPGSSVTISSLPAISGTVTANLVGWDGGNFENTRIGGYSVGGGDSNRLALEVIGVDGNPLAISGTVTVGALNVWDEGNQEYSTVRGYSVGNFGSALQVIGCDEARLINGIPSLPVCGTVTVSNSITIGSLPAISGTVTANTGINIGGALPNGIQSGIVPVVILDDEGRSVNDTPNRGLNTFIRNSVTIGSLPVQLSTTTIGGTARLNVTLSSATTVGGTVPNYANLYGGSDGTNLRAISVDTSGRTVVTGSTSILGTPSVTMGAISGTVTVGNSVTIGSLPAISGTVTANNPNGALTTRFGSVTTANTSLLTSCVTNTSRKYLLAQNISAGTVTIGIGFSPTTTQGIQLSAGGGISFDSFCPTGAVYWLGATTGANFTILEG